MGVPPGFEPGVSRTTVHCPPMACWNVDALAAISCPYETRFYDVIRLSAFSSQKGRGLKMGFPLDKNLEM